MLRPQNLDCGPAAGRYFAVHEHSRRKTSSVIKALYEHDVVTSMTGYACICAKAARLHYTGISEHYCSHTVLRGLTRQNYHVWTTKLRVFGPHRCILSMAVAYLHVDTPKSRHVFTTYETSNSFQVSHIPYRSCQTVHYTQVNDVPLFHTI